MRDFRLLLTVLLLADACITKQPLRVTYLGNEGFLVQSGSNAILFDALFGQGLPDYDRVPPTATNDMKSGRPPFKKIDALFISHPHPDHFDAASTARFLDFHPRTAVFAPPDVTKQLEAALVAQSQTNARIFFPRACARPDDFSRRKRPARRSIRAQARQC